MAIRADLYADRERGPGYALLRITGLRPSGGFDFAIERSQGSAPYLAPGGAWQPTEAWHTAAAATQADDSPVHVTLGPELVDALVQQGAAVTFRAWVATGAGKEGATLVVHRPLLGSRAAAPHEPEPVLPAPAPAAAETPTPAGDEAAPGAPAPLTPVDPWLRPEPERARRAPWLALAGAVLVLIGFGAIAWSRCWVHACGAAPPGVAAPESAGVAVRGSRSCAGLDGPRCLDVAREAMRSGELEAARQLLQQASQLGAVAANLDMARMYDPQTWTADTSPVAQPDWETAAYWYETAARQNDPAGQLGAGRLLCSFAAGEFERRRGLAYLQAAVAAGSDEARTLAAECEKKVTP